MSLTFATTRFPLCSCLCALAALVLLAIPGAAQNTATLTVLTLDGRPGNQCPVVSNLCFGNDPVHRYRRLLGSVRRSRGDGVVRGRQSIPWE